MANGGTSGKAVATLILGILSIVSCFILGIVAIVMGNQEKAAIAAGQSSPEGEGMVKAGIICAWIGIVIQLGSIALWLVFVVILGVAGGLS